MTKRSPTSKSNFMSIFIFCPFLPQNGQKSAEIAENRDLTFEKKNILAILVYI